MLPQQYFNYIHYLIRITQKQWLYGLLRLAALMEANNAVIRINPQNIFLPLTTESR